jgi:hypothetical protein
MRNATDGGKADAIQALPQHIVVGDASRAAHRRTPALRRVPSPGGSLLVIRVDCAEALDGCRPLDDQIPHAHGGTPRPHCRDRLVHRGDVGRIRAFGSVDRTSNTSITSLTVVQAGLRSKSVSACGVMRLVQEAKTPDEDRTTGARAETSPSRGSGDPMPVMIRGEAQERIRRRRGAAPRPCQDEAAAQVRTPHGQEVKAVTMSRCDRLR